MRTRMTGWTAALLLIAAASFAPNQALAESKDETALREADLAWAAAAARKDVDATVAFMAADGETLPPNGPAARDRAAVRNVWVEMLGLRNVAIDWKPQRVEVAKSGDLGFASGTYTLSWTGDDGKRIDDRGKYLEVWKKIDGKWKCLSDMYSSDIPLP